MFRENIVITNLKPWSECGRGIRDTTYSYIANAGHFASCPTFTHKFIKRTKAPLARDILECFDVERMTERTDKTATTVR
jgi:hypothetical protein